MRQNKNTWFYIGGSGLDRTVDFQKICLSGLDRIQFYQNRTGVWLKNFTVRSSLVLTVLNCTITASSGKGVYDVNTTTYSYSEKNISQSREWLGKKQPSLEQYAEIRYLQTKTPEKEHVNLSTQVECERCFEAYVVIFTCIFRCSA